MAQKIKLLAHDSKPGADCLLNLGGRFEPTGLRLRDVRSGTSFVPKRMSQQPRCVRRRSLYLMRPYSEIKTMFEKSSQTSGRLRVTQAFIALSGLQRSNAAPRTISVVRLGKCEIRMFNSSCGVPLVWIELFDHDAQLAVDSCSCREIVDAVAAFDEFVLQAATLNQAWRPDVNDAQA